MPTAAFDIQERIEAARDTVKQAKRDAEEIRDEAVYRIKKNPLQSISVAAAAGLGVGLVLGLAAGRCAARLR